MTLNVKKFEAGDRVVYEHMPAVVLAKSGGILKNKTQIRDSYGYAKEVLTKDLRPAE